MAGCLPSSCNTLIERVNVGNQRIGEALISDTSLKHFYLEVKPTEINKTIYLMSDGPILLRNIKHNIDLRETQNTLKLWDACLVNRKAHLIIALFRRTKMSSVNFAYYF